MDGGPPRFPQGFTCLVVLWIPAHWLSFRLQEFYPLRLAFPGHSAKIASFFCRSSTPDVRRLPVWALPSSLAATGGISFDYSSSGYLDVSVHQVCRPFGCLLITAGGLPHSETFGSMPTCGSPNFFAAYRVLHRLLTPRHPPYALCSLLS